VSASKSEFYRRRRNRINEKDPFGLTSTALTPRIPFPPFAVLDLLDQKGRELEGEPAPKIAPTSAAKTAAAIPDLGAMSEEEQLQLAMQASLEGTGTAHKPLVMDSDDDGSDDAGGDYEESDDSDVEGAPRKCDKEEEVADLNRNAGH
jgi:hypothetical protein